MAKEIEIKREKGRLVLELQATIRIPVEFIPVSSSVVRDAVKLTHREREVLGGVLKALCHKEIAQELHLSVRTVKFHACALYRKFQVRDRIALLALFKSAVADFHFAGLTSPDDVEKK